MGRLRVDELWAASLLCVPIAYSQQPSSKVPAGMSPELVAEPHPFRLWENDAPGALGSETPSHSGGPGSEAQGSVSSVLEPGATFTVYLPDPTTPSGP
jgi:hypothetical protein